VKEILESQLQPLSIFNGPHICFSKKYDHLMISSIFASLNMTFHSNVSLMILLKMILTYTKPIY
jgi:hypothetical protein